jgi:aspartate aminotransferase
MPKTETAVLDLASFVQEPVPEAGAGPAARAPRFSAMASALVGSEILRIAAEIRALKAAGRQICDLTVGDFNPRYFPIPAGLTAGVRDALERRETNYPPANGMPELRQAVGRFYARELGLSYPQGSILIVGGARPAVYCTFRTLCDPGDRVVYPVPSWNNNHYVHLVGAVGVPVPCGPEHRFMPTEEALRAVLPGARLLCLNSPLNPTGTAIERDALHGICAAILAENEGRRRRGERPLYLMYDHIYWMLRFGDTEHVTPPELLPEMARYTILVDGVSKAFAATGLRVGWAVGPVDVIARMSALVGHVGAWAPRAEQVATAALLDDEEGIRAYQAIFNHNLEARLALLHRGLQELKAQGLAVDSIPPTGAIYLTARLHPFGRRTPEGAVLSTNDDVRRYVLESAAIGLVPFQAFGAPDEDGWFRMSAGAVSEPDIAAALPRLAAALLALA